MKARTLRATLALVLACLPVSGCVSPFTPGPEQVPTPNSTAGKPMPSASVARFLAANVRTYPEMGSAPLAAGKYLFWLKNEGTWDKPMGAHIQGFNFDRNEVFTVTMEPGPYSSLNSDGKTLVWLSGHFGSLEGTSLHALDLATGKEYDVSTRKHSEEPGYSDPSEVNVDGDTVYYTDATGLYAINLRTGEEREIPHWAFRFVVRQGTMLWVQGLPRPPLPTIEVDEHGYDKNGSWVKGIDLRPIECEVRMLGPGEEGDGISLAEGVDIPGGNCSGAFSNYAISGDRIVWNRASNSYSYIEPGSADAIRVYSMSSGTTKIIQASASAYPTIDNNVVLWTNKLGQVPDIEYKVYKIKAYNLDTGSEWTVVAETKAMVEAWGIVGGQAVAYTVSGQHLNADLYITDLYGQAATTHQTDR